MSHNETTVSRAIRRYSVLTCLVALLPIGIGSVVTTLKAGMAFADWPTSDGQNMLLYPWLNDLRNTDKFVEHGHRLAGMLIGFVSIGLVVVAFTKERLRWVRLYATAILIAVIGQGLLGGMRVRMNAQVLAMIHSITGGLFFTLCFNFVVATHRPSGGNLQRDQRTPVWALGLAILLPVIVLGQYVLGGLFRHLGTMLHEHLMGAVAVFLAACAVIIAVRRSQISALRRRSLWLASALFVQIALGLGSWVTKMGLPSTGRVVVANSPAQNVICSLHTVGGMFLLATATALTFETIVCLRRGQFESTRDVFAPTMGSQEGMA
ncbi:MAG: COX15/CtaA family protein [Planctomycetaceae bacterium]|nr:COX15/CtaA family protein [Planctomycetaceae bacterium]